MTVNILYPEKVELLELSERVGGLVTASYFFNAGGQAEAEKTATQIATGQTLGYRPDNLSDYADYVGRVTKVFYKDNSAQADVVFPAKLFGNDTAGLLTVVFGKISFYPNLKLEAISADRTYLASLKGPRFGLSGIKKLAGKDRSNLPLLMAILKPGMGPSDDVLADQYSRLIDAGTDLVKDDETRIDVTVDDALRRLDRVMTVAKGRGIYVTHLTGPAFEVAGRAKKLQANGAKAFLFCPFTYGISVLQSLCQDPEIRVPIFAHPAFTGPITSGESAVAAKVALGSILRWAGCDAVLFPSPYGSISLPKPEALALHNSLICAEGDLKMVASVPSAGIVPELVASIREDFGSDVIVNAGTGMARPGVTVDEGVQAFKQAIDRHFN